MRSLFHLPTFLVLAVLGASVGNAAPCEQMQIQLPQSNIDLTPNPNVNATVIVKANTQPGGCSFFITADYGSASSFSTRALRMGGYQWPFQLSKDLAATQVLKTLSDASGNDSVLTGTMPASSGNDYQVSLNFWVTLNTANPWLRYGNYTDNMTLRLYKGTLASNTLERTINLSVNYNAPKRADLSLVPSGGSFALTDTDEILDFGPLSTGAVRSCDIVMKTNAGYTLFASSANNSRLKHLTMNQYVPYTTTFSGTTVNLGSSATNPVQVERVLGVSPPTGFVKPVSVTIGSTAGAQSGNYQDIITLTVQTSE